MMSAGQETAAHTDHVGRVLRALRISGRRLARFGDRWSVVAGGDRRKKGRLPLEREDVEKLEREGAIVAVDADSYVLADTAIEPAPQIEPWAFIAAGVRRQSDLKGYGFAALALQARREEGPVTLRQIRAGMRLITDVEQSENVDRVTTDWDAGPADKQKRSGRSGGLKGMAIDAARSVRRARAMCDPLHWALAWALCVEGQPLRKVRQRFGLSQRVIHAKLADALEALANAYER